MCGRGFFHSRLSSLRILRAQILNHHVPAIARLIFSSLSSLMIENDVGIKNYPAMLWFSYDGVAKVHVLFLQICRKHGLTFTIVQFHRNELSYLSSYFARRWLNCSCGNYFGTTTKPTTEI